MSPKPETLTNADSLLQQSETIPDHQLRARRIKEAFDSLNAYLKENPSSEHREYIENRKQSYLRSHLRQLSTLTDPDVETWFFNFVLFTTSEREVTCVLEQDPELKAWYEAFVHSEWAKNELVPLLQCALSTT